MDKAKIIFINGPSSAGKTTLSMELQAKAPGYWYRIPLDGFLEAVPSREWDRDDEEGYQTAYDMHHDCVKLLAGQGKNIIVDTVILSKESFLSFEERLAGYPVLMVRVTCPLEELKRREKARGDRFTGLAAGQAERIFPQKSYDLIVDTYAETTEECAGRIIRLLESPVRPLAFDRLAANKSEML